MRIRHYDALVNIFHHALLQNHPGALKEQRASFAYNARPGDRFHPDFQHGRPAYFDVSVRSTTQCSHISSSASGAGVAAAAGEVAKDARHLDIVEKVGGDSIPLVVECLEYELPLLYQFCIPFLTVLVVSPVKRPEEIFCSNFSKSVDK